MEALIVDDEKPLRMLYEIELKQSGYSVTHAVTGADAIELMRSYYTPNLIVLDIRMPETTGKDVIDYLLTRNDLEEIHVIIATASPQYEDYVQLLPAADFVLKPNVLPPLREILSRITA